MDLIRSAMSTPVSDFGCKRTARSLVLLSAGTVRPPAIAHQALSHAPKLASRALPPQEGLHRYLFAETTFVYCGRQTEVTKNCRLVGVLTTFAASEAKD